MTVARRQLSLTARLTAFFTLGAAAVLLGLGALLMAATERHFQELDRGTLQAKLQLVRGLLAGASTPQALRERLQAALAEPDAPLVAVRTAGGDILFKSPGLTLPAEVSAHAGHGDGAGMLSWREGGESGGRAFHALSADIAGASAGAGALQVLVAMDMQVHEQFMAELRRSLLLYVLLATLVSGLLGWLAARQGLVPLLSMKARAARVTARQLSQRMPVEAVPVEMADLAQALNDMLARLEQDFQRLSAFSSDLAHELRTPISNLLMQTQVALSQPRAAEAYRDILASNAEEFQRLARMVSDMLLLAKTEGGLDLPSRELFAAAAEAQALFEFYEALAEEKGIALALEGEGQVLGDRLMFRRALSNLLSNALRHAQANSQVLVAIEDQADAVVVAVVNTGPDIPLELQPRLFDRFWRADASRAHPDGAGLGLAITRAIVQAHGGSVQVASGGGTTRFSLRFPRPVSAVQTTQAAH